MRASHDKIPDRDAALALYKRRAPIYDAELALIEPIRRRAIARLAARPADTVLDVGCGTGLSFQALQRAVGADGQIVGIEQSPHMLEHAQRRIDEHGWRNVTLICASAEQAQTATRADAALFHFTHDILRDPRAVANIIDQLKPAARVVACGLKWAPPWAVPVNLFVWPAALHSVTSLEGLHRPWSHLCRWLGEPELEPMLGGGAYIATFTRSAGQH
jgi:SAM-dependent methyltransferase